MSNKSAAKYVYGSAIAILIVTTLSALYDGGYGIESGTVAAIALASIVTSFLPSYISMRLLRKYKEGPERKASLKLLALLLYVFCFPVKIWIIYSNLALLIKGDNGWSLG